MDTGWRDDFFFLQQANSSEKRPGVTGTGRGRRGMGYDADGAGCGVGLVGMVVKGFGRRCP